MKIHNEIPAGVSTAGRKGRTRGAEFLKFYNVLDKEGIIKGLTLESAKTLGGRFNGWVRTDSNRTARVVRRVDAKGQYALIVVPVKAPLPLPG